MADPPPLVEAAPRYLEAPAPVSAPAPPDLAEPAPAGWWRAFGDVDLDGLVEAALRSNLDVRSLAARIAQAAAIARQSRGRVLPAIDALAEYREEWREGEPRARASSVGALLAWEVDVWGRLRFAWRAAQLAAAAAAEDWRAGRLVLSAAVAETYFEILEERLVLELLEEQIEANEILLDLTRLRFGQGQSSIVDVLQQREQLASTLALVPEVEGRLGELEYILDVLLGKPPGGRDRFATRPLPAPRPLPALGVPADLLEERPDVRAARRRVEAIDREVGAAIADRLPRFSIGAAIEGAGAPGIETLIGSAVAGLVAPLFDGGVRRAEVALQRARLEEALASFSQTYLLAVRDVETALVGDRTQARRVLRLEEELAIARSLLVETRNRYSQGLTDYLPVLNAVVTVQELERDVIASRRERLSTRVALHRALGGPMLHLGLAKDFDLP